MRSERELLAAAYGLIGHALPGKLQTEIFAALGKPAPKLESDDVAKLINLAQRTMWIALCWNDHNFDASHKYAKADTEGAGFTDIAQANAWLEKMEAALAEHDSRMSEIYLEAGYCNNGDGATFDQVLSEFANRRIALAAAVRERNALQNRLALVTSELAALQKLFERIDEESHPDNKCLPSGAASYEFAENADRTVDHLRRIAQEGIRKTENLKYKLEGEK
jgi:hypothetical protein